ncbi:hypothetical protein WJX72_006995 [[Myrmecia] bisecta]|uniref:Uncharacterized protein n=1 Tax=[Myrmecia] bisecta TaxID=41462 RepID=A0AAW1PK82_9CHLO
MLSSVRASSCLASSATGHRSRSCVAVKAHAGGKQQHVEKRAAAADKAAEAPRNAVKSAAADVLASVNNAVEGVQAL